MFAKFLEEEIKLLEDGDSWAALDKIEQNNVSSVHQELKHENEEEEFRNFFDQVCKNIMELDGKSNPSDINSVMEEESYINYRRSEKDGKWLEEKSNNLCLD